MAILASCATGQQGAHAGAIPSISSSPAAAQPTDADPPYGTVELNAFCEAFPEFLQSLSHAATRTDLYDAQQSWESAQGYWADFIGLAPMSLQRTAHPAGLYLTDFVDWLDKATPQQFDNLKTDLPVRLKQELSDFLGIAKQAEDFAIQHHCTTSDEIPGPPPWPLGGNSTSST